MVRSYLQIWPVPLGTYQTLKNIERKTVTNQCIAVQLCCVGEPTWHITSFQSMISFHRMHLLKLLFCSVAYWILQFNTINNTILSTNTIELFKFYFNLKVCNPTHFYNGTFSILVASSSFTIPSLVTPSSGSSPFCSRQQNISRYLHYPIN